LKPFLTPISVAIERNIHSSSYKALVSSIISPSLDATRRITAVRRESEI
jgi:hypothetical protein